MVLCVTRGDLVCSDNMRVWYTGFSIRTHRESVGFWQQHPMKYKKSAELIVLGDFISGEGVNPKKKRYTPLPPQYVVGFVDGEGSFNVSISKHKTASRGVTVQAVLQIELRADDADVLFRIRETLGCGNMYLLRYKRYAWKPHIMMRVGKKQDLTEKIIPFFRRYKLQSKKARIFNLFATIVRMIAAKRHLSEDGFAKIRALREEMRRIGKKANVRFGNR